MSVDKTIEELSGTLAQLSILVEHINTQIVGISARINLTLDNFDDSIKGIATDAGVMTGQVTDTISQVPNSWVFYLLLITIIIVLVLVSVLIVISLISKIQELMRTSRGQTSRVSTPLPSLVYSESKQPLSTSYPHQTPHTSPDSHERLRHIALPMESEPRRYGVVHTTSSAAGGSAQQVPTIRVASTSSQFHGSQFSPFSGEFYKEEMTGEGIRSRPYAMPRATQQEIQQRRLDITNAERPRHLEEDL